MICNNLGVNALLSNDIKSYENKYFFDNLVFLSINDYVSTLLKMLKIRCLQYIFFLN